MRGGTNGLIEDRESCRDGNPEESGYLRGVMKGKRRFRNNEDRYALRRKRKSRSSQLSGAVRRKRMLRINRNPHALRMKRKFRNSRPSGWQDRKRKEEMTGRGEILCLRSNVWHQW
jgi:hypothetical protein